MKKFMMVAGIAAGLTVAMSMTAFAGEWKQDNTGWWYQNDDGSYPTSQWQWIDGNGDGIAENYYFDSNGYMAVNTEINGLTINGDGAWTLNGIVKTGILFDINIVKPEFIDILKKDKEYVVDKLGTPDYMFSSSMYYSNYNIDIFFESNKIYKISSYNEYALFDTTKYSIEEIDNMLGRKPGEKGMWHYSDQNHNVNLGNNTEFGFLLTGW